MKNCKIYICIIKLNILCKNKRFIYPKKYKISFLTINVLQIYYTIVKTFSNEKYHKA